MAERTETSEAILAITSVFTGLVTAICPGAMIGFFLPQWAGFPFVLACAGLGPWLMYRVDLSLYGPRPADATHPHSENNHDH